MIFSETDNQLLVRYFSEYAGRVVAFSTTRHTIPGSDQPKYSQKTDDQSGANRKKLAEILGISPGNLVFPQQVHSNDVAVIDGQPTGEPERKDALVTGRPGICLCIQTADCVPVLLYDPVRNVIAAIHAGWRGTVTRIAWKTVKQMTALFHSSPGDIRAVLGPSIGPDVYEVGQTVIDAVLKNIPDGQKSIQTGSSGKFYFNLWEANRQDLLASGLMPENIELSGQCTYRQHDRYFSARREGPGTGRLVSGIMLKS